MSAFAPRPSRPWWSEIPREHHATRLSFFIAGFFMAVWASLVPFVKTHLGLDEGSFGLLLLALGLGGLIAMPAAGAWVARAGARRVLACSVPVCGALLVALALTLWLPLEAASLAGALVTGLGLLLFGMAFGGIDVGMNVHSVVVDARSPKRLLSGFHALYSVGGVAGALAMTALLHLSFSPVAAAMLLTVLFVLVWFKVGRWVIEEAGREEKKSGDKTPLFVLPRGGVLFLGAVCFILFLAEGAVLDWSGLFLTETRGMCLENAGLGFAFFSVAMTVMRFLGDRLIARIGPRATVRTGAFLAALALLLAVGVDSGEAALLAFFLLGVGSSNIVPIAFAATGEQKEMPMALALASATTLGYAGLLTGPALIGFVAHRTSLSTAFLCEAALLLAVALAAGRFRAK